MGLASLGWPQFGFGPCFLIGSEAFNPRSGKYNCGLNLRAYLPLVAATPRFTASIGTQA